MKMIPFLLLIACANAVLHCESEVQGDCIACIEGFKLVDSVCYRHCPSGWVESSGGCIWSEDSEYIAWHESPDESSVWQSADYHLPPSFSLSVEHSGEGAVFALEGSVHMSLYSEADSYKCSLEYYSEGWKFETLSVPKTSASPIILETRQGKDSLHIRLMMASSISEITLDQAELRFDKDEDQSPARFSLSQNTKKLTLKRNLTSCELNCDTCSGTLFYQCNSCTSAYYYLNGICHPYCPTGYQISGNSCTISNDMVFHIKPHDIEAVVSDLSFAQVPVQSGKLPTFNPDFDERDPYPVSSDRGYYFENSVMRISPYDASTTLKVILSSGFVFNTWIYHMSDGVLLAKQSSGSFTVVSRIETISNVPTTTLKLTYGGLSTAHSCENALVQNQWNLLLIRVKFESNNTYIKCEVNGVSDSAYSDRGTGVFVDENINYVHVIGGFHDGTDTFRDFWRGMLWEMKILNQYYITTTEHRTSCSSSVNGSSCSLCPDTTGKCICDCAYNEFVEGGSCVECLNTATCGFPVCRDNTQCNLCNDIECKDCPTWDNDVCIECKEHGHLSGNTCVCDSNAAWDEITELCDPCHDSCEMCFAEYSTTCTDCYATDYNIQNTCMPFCPTGYPASLTSFTCGSSTKDVFYGDLTEIHPEIIDSAGGDVKMLAGSTINFYPYFDSLDPLPAVDRGHHFDEQLFEFIQDNSTPVKNNANQMTMTPKHAFSLWVMPEALPGVLMSKQDTSSAFENVFRLSLNDTGFVVIDMEILGVGPMTHTCDLNLTLNEWNYLHFRTTISDGHSYITCNINGQTDAVPGDMGTGYFRDVEEDYVFGIGAEYTGATSYTNYFTGFIRELHIYNYEADLSAEVSTTCTGGCSVCDTTGICYPTCPLLQYYDWDLETCIDCDPICDKGCVRTTDCVLCNDTLCEVCNDYHPGNCTDCFSNLLLTIYGNCTCDTGTFYNYDSGMCEPCFAPNCVECEGLLNGDCTECHADYVLDQGLCVENCRTSYVVDDGACVGFPGVGFDLRFTWITNEVPDNKTGALAYMGSTDGYYKDAYDAHDPYPIYLRGLYFDGTQQYARLPPNPADANSVAFGNFHTALMWVRLYSHGDDHYMFSKEDSGTIQVSLHVDSSRIPSALHRMYQDYTKAASVFTTTGPALAAWDQWAQLAIKFDRVGNSTTITLFTNGVAGTPTTIANHYLEEEKVLTFFLGKQDSTSKFTKGFIYNLKIWNYAEDPPAIPSTCSCTACTEDNECLVSCTYQEYYESNSCIACDGPCSTGCILFDNCRLNFDQLCGEATGFLPPECIDCVHLGEGHGTGCTCKSDATYDVPLHTCDCDTGYRDLHEDCYACYLPIRTQDIDAYFAADYINLVFDFTVAMIPNTTSECSELFEKTSYSTFGQGHTCTWNAAMDSLTVKLGSLPTILNNVVTFRSEKLFGVTLDCSVPNGEVNIQIQYKLDKPTITVQPIIDYNNLILTKCEDLVLDGSGSLGGYFRPLTFSWKFESNPVILELGLFEESSDEHEMVFLARDTLPDAVATFELTVENWLGSSAYATGNFEINIRENLLLTLDSSLSTTMKTSQKKEIYLKPGTNCETSKDYQYEMILESLEGDDAFADEYTIWRSQYHPAILYIPSGTLKPGLYKFKIDVEDEEKSLFGSKYIEITVEKEDLIADIKESHKTVSVSQAFSIDASQSYDPSKISGNLKFEWTCEINEQTCDELIPTPTSSTINIPGDSLVVSLDYTFKVKVYKDTRESYDSIIIKVVSAETVPNVVFSDLPKLHNRQERLSIHATVDNPDQYSPSWQSIIGGAFTSDTGLGTYYLEVPADTLAPGFTYTFRLTLDNIPFEISVPVNQPPTAGTLSVSPSSGIGLETLFWIEATGFSDLEDADLPLEYEFGYTVNGEYLPLNIRNETSVLQSRLPYVTDAKVWVKAFDSVGSYILVEEPVTISKSSGDDIQTALDYAREQLNYPWSDPSNHMLSVYQLDSAIIQNEDASDVQKAKAIEFGLESVSNAISLIKDESDIEASILLLRQISNSTLASEYMDTVKSRAEELKALSATYKNLDFDQLKYYVQLLETTMPLSYNVIRNSTANLDYSNDFIKSLLQTTIDSFVVNKTETVESDYAKVKYAKLSTSMFSEFSMENDGFSVTISEYDFKMTKDILMIYTVYKDQTDSQEEEINHAVEFALIDMADYTSLSVDSVLLQIPISNIEDSSKMDCVYRSDGLWIKSGCSVSSITDTHVLCECNHLSLFSAGTDLNQAPSGPEPAGFPVFEVIIAVSGFVLITVIVVAIVIYCKRRNKRKIKPAIVKKFANPLNRQGEVLKETNKKIIIEDDDDPFFTKTNKPNVPKKKPKEDEITLNTEERFARFFNVGK